MNLKLVESTSPILYQVTEPVTDIKKQVKPFYKDMVKIMLSPRDKVKGVGLAAPQVGLSLRFFVMVLRGPIVCVNPVITKFSTEKESIEEGCLSFPNKKILVERPVWIEAKWYDERGLEYSQKLEGFPARIFQHEIDHLNGKNIFDKISN